MKRILKTLTAAILTACSAYVVTASDYAHYYQNLPVGLRKATPVSVPGG